MKFCTFFCPSPESNRERIAFGPLLITVLYLALKKNGFSKKKILPPPKKNFFYLFSMQLFSADATMFSKNFQKFKFFCPPKHKKKCPQKLLIIPLDQQFLVQQVFALWNWDSLKVWNFLIFEVVKLCRMKKYLKIYMMQVQ